MEVKQATHLLCKFLLARYFCSGMSPDWHILRQSPCTQAGSCAVPQTGFVGIPVCLSTRG